MALTNDEAAHNAATALFLSLSLPPLSSILDCNRWKRDPLSLFPLVSNEQVFPRLRCRASALFLIYSTFVLVAYLDVESWKPVRLSMRNVWSWRSFRERERMRRFEAGCICLHFEGVEVDFVETNAQKIFDPKYEEIFLRARIKWIKPSSFGESRICFHSEEVWGFFQDNIKIRFFFSNTSIFLARSRIKESFSSVDQYSILGQIFNYKRW